MKRQRQAGIWNLRKVPDAKCRISNIKFIILASIGFLLVSLSVCASANAASLYFSPASGSHKTGETFTVNVLVSSPEQTMNAASGVISFPPDKLEVSSLSKTGSIFSLWVQEPSFSAVAGVVNFEGIVLNPGFVGTDGKIFAINFKSKAAGNSSLNFASGSVLANDGKGTNILTNLGSADFSLTAVVSPTPQTTAPVSTSPEITKPAAGVPQTPIVTSPTHPDQEKWYSNNKPKFTWPLSGDITAVRLLFNKNPTSQPTVLYSEPINEKQLDEVTDGIWYFHCQFKNVKGWGGISHFKFQIDTKPPEPFKIQVIDGQETDNPRPTILFDTVDTLSGVDYYKVKIGDSTIGSLSYEEKKANPYTLQPQTPGEKTILVQAYDKAGNYSVGIEEIVIKPLQPPQITDYPQKLQAGDSLFIKGRSPYLNADVTFWLQRDKEEPKSQIVPVDKDGGFVFVAGERMTSGVYKIWAELTDERGAKSTPSEKITLVVESSKLWSAGSKLITWLAVVVPLVGLVFLLVFLLWYIKNKFAAWKKNVRQETREAQETLHRSFELLREDIQKQVEMLEKTKGKRQLTKEETEILKQLNKNLTKTEKTVQEEIKDIVKGVRP